MDHESDPAESVMEGGLETTSRVLARARSLLVVVAFIAGCGGSADAPSVGPLPSPTCGGIKIRIEGALPCDEVVRIAIAELAERAPDQIARGVTAIDVFLGACPREEVPPQIDCGDEEFAQLVTVTFRDAPAGGAIEPALTVAIAPVSGAVLGIENPLVR